jgi:hypothetical protein
MEVPLCMGIRTPTLADFGGISEATLSILENKAPATPEPVKFSEDTRDLTSLISRIGPRQLQSALKAATPAPATADEQTRSESLPGIPDNDEPNGFTTELASLCQQMTFDTTREIPPIMRLVSMQEMATVAAPLTQNLGRDELNGWIAHINEIITSNRSDIISGEQLRTVCGDSMSQAVAILMELGRLSADTSSAAIVYRVI